MEDLLVALIAPLLRTILRHLWLWLLIAVTCTLLMQSSKPVADADYESPITDYCPSLTHSRDTFERLMKLIQEAADKGASGASLGAVIALAFGLNIPGVPYAGTMALAMLFAFGSLALILLLAWALDRSFSTQSIILIGVIFSMFASALTSLVVTFAGERVKSITFWTMGSFAGSRMDHAAILCGALLVCGGVILAHTRALNAFAVGEENARAVGVNVRRVKLTVMVAVSVLIGVCVSVGGTIAFVGLVTPHMARLVVGPNHRRLLPASLFAGAIFMVLADLAARTLLSPRQLPVGVVTSLTGAVVFVVLLIGRKRRLGGGG